LTLHQISTHVFSKPQVTFHFRDGRFRTRELVDIVLQTRLGAQSKRIEHSAQACAVQFCSSVVLGNSLVFNSAVSNRLCVRSKPDLRRRCHLSMNHPRPSSSRITSTGTTTAGTTVLRFVTEILSNQTRSCFHVPGPSLWRLLMSSPA
jgi:hypothetical protein